MKISNLGYEGKGYCTRCVEVEYLDKDDEIAVPRIEKNHLDSFSELDLSLDFLSSLRSSSVLNTLTEDWLLNLGSLDHIGQFSFNASAKYGASLLDLCGDTLNASDSNSLKESLGNDSTNFVRANSASLNCSELNLEYFNISDSFFFSSSIAYSGMYNFNPNESAFIIMNRTGLSLKNETNMLASTTNCIFYQPSSLYFFHIPSLTLSPNLKQSSSVSSDFSSILSSFFNNNALLAFSERNFLTDSDQFISGKESNLFFNSSGTDNVIFGIFAPPSNSVHTVEAVEIYKGFDLS